MPLTTLEARTGFDPRRADLALWYLLDVRALRPRDLHTPSRVPLSLLARVHTPELLDRLTRPEELARIFAIDPWDVPVDALLHAIRLATGGTVAAARAALARKGPTLNLQGGFHHAAPDRAGGNCAVNDIAVAIAALRAEGYGEPVAVIDLDAHPPDGTAACLARDGNAWIGSISASDWGPLEGAGTFVFDECLPPDSGDEVYAAALDRLLARRPAAGLTFVLAGGDVLAGDPLGRLGLTLEGARERDRRVAAALDGHASVWLPAGGYRPDAWKVLAGTALAHTRPRAPAIPRDADPLRTRYAHLGAKIAPDRLHASAPTAGNDLFGDPMSVAELEADLGVRRRSTGLLLGHYTAEGVEYALSRYGLLAQVERLGYHDLRVRIDATDLGDRMRLTGVARPQPAPGAPAAPDTPDTEHLLVESVLERRHIDGAPMLYVHWLTLRHPLGAVGRAPLPGQEVPGLGMAREAGELLARMAMRLGLDGVALRPAHFHVAYAARYRCMFLDPERQGRFEALLRDLHGVDAGTVSRALEERHITMNGEIYAWEPAVMTERVTAGWAPSAEWVARKEAEKGRVKFERGP